MNRQLKDSFSKLEKSLNLNNYAQRTIEIYIHYIKEFVLCVNKPPSLIMPRDIELYIRNYNYSSISQQNQIYSALKAFGKHKQNPISIDKCVPERPRKEKHLPKIIDKEFLINRISGITNLKHRAILSLGYSVGLRVSEVCNLKIKDIDSKRMVIRIVQSKGNKDRIVPLSNNMLKLLRDYFVQYKPSIYLFNGQNSLKYSHASCNKLVKKYIGKEYHFHLLRHSTFTYLTDKGIDIRVIQKLAGHSSIKTTQIYTQVSTNTLNNIPLNI
ncbi:MAG: tyrosine-type recombinase/integrase [Bacteroidota bacterium]